MPRAAASPSGLLEPAVTFTAFSHDATCMATVELRPDSGTGDATSGLKFWEADTSALGPAAYTVNTLLEDPHGGPVESLAFHPSEFVAVTAGTSCRDGSGEFRVWVRQPHKRAPGARRGGGNCHWRCRSVASYKGVFSAAVMFSGSTVDVKIPNM